MVEPKFECVITSVKLSFSCYSPSNPVRGYSSIKVHLIEAVLAEGFTEFQKKYLSPTHSIVDFIIALEAPSRFAATFWVR